MSFLRMYHQSVQWTGQSPSWFTLVDLFSDSFYATIPEGEALTYEVLSGNLGGIPQVEFENVIQTSSAAHPNYLSNQVLEFEDENVTITRTVHLGQLDWGVGQSTVVIAILETFNGFYQTESFIPIAGDRPPVYTTLTWDHFYDSITYRGPLKDFSIEMGQPIPIEAMTLVRSEPLPSVSETGTEADEEISGGFGSDVLDGGSGDDTLNGLASNDSLKGGLGNDVINGGSGVDTLIGGAGDDTLIGGDSEDDRRDDIYGGEGDDNIDGGYGNDELRGDAGNDTIAGGFGADTVIGGTGNDVLTGSAFGDQIFGGAGDDFINGGFGFDLLNGGADSDRFFHLGIADHGSDWVQDYDAAEGDILQFGITTATASQFQVNTAHTATAAGERSGDDNVEEAFVIYRPTGQIMWALVDGGGQSSINLQIGQDVFDLLA